MKTEGDEFVDNYTAIMEQKAYEAADDYYPRDKILEAAEMFRMFADSMDIFIKEHGYFGDPDNIEEKADFIKYAFERAGIPIPRGIKEWFTKEKGIRRTTAFQICFAFGLDRKETDAFFRRVMLTRSFDLHVMEEVVYYFCMQKGLDYAKAIEIMNASPKDEVPQVTKSRMVFDENILLTSEIEEDLEKFCSEKDLLAYFRSNVERFGYNNAGATQKLQKLWGEIREKKKGLADREKKQIHRAAVSAKADRSISDILNQILGLDETEITDQKSEPLFVLNADRSLKPLLKDNPLLPEIAQKQFPNRQTLEKILKGDHVETESIRKTMILTYFYYFWIKKALRVQDEQDKKASLKMEGNETDRMPEWNLTSYQAREGDDGRFIDNCNRYLLEAGYPELYIGNPYDWIFLYCSRSEEPLTVFREFIHEMYLENETYIKEWKEKDSTKSHR